MKKGYDARLTRFEATGALACGGLAVLLHGLYQWTGGAIWAGLLSAANESVWEQGKILLVPYALWSILEFLFLKPSLKRFAVAKTAGLFAMLGMTIAFYYTYSGIIGYSVTAVDIISGFVWLALGHILSYAILSTYKHVEQWFTLCVFLLILLAVMFISFTVNPPRVGLFQDPITGQYGLPSIIVQSSIPV